MPPFRRLDGVRNGGGRCAALRLNLADGTKPACGKRLLKFAARARDDIILSYQAWKREATDLGTE